MSWMWIVACAQHGAAPRVEASGGGAGYWPPNSRRALEGAAASEFTGIELDLGLTRDHEPVLLDGPWVDPERCTRPDGAPIERILLHRLTLQQLWDGYVCGGIAD